MTLFIISKTGVSGPRVQWRHQWGTEWSQWVRLEKEQLSLRGKFDRLQGDYSRVRESNAHLSDRLQEVKLENKALRQVSADYERVKWVFGPERVEAVVQADKQREQTEKDRKQRKRAFALGG